MNALWTNSELLERLAGSLLHFIWQGALIAFVSALLLRLLARRSAASRYAVAVLCLGLMVLAPCLTFIFYPETGGATLRVLQFISRSAAEAGRSANAGGVEVWTSWIVIAWAAGVSVCGIRLLMGWILSRSMIRSARVAIPVGIGRLMEQMRGSLLGSRQVRFRIGDRVDSPVVFGWLRPVVLLPVTAITGLSEDQLLAVLAHELAHIRRHDFLVNALQRGVEAVLFYHPAVWWLSSRIRSEREHCCDDLAVQVCGDRFVYAEALIELERARATMPALAIPAAAGNLSERVRRVLGVRSVNRDWQPAAAALLLVAICALAGSWQTETIAATALVSAPPSVQLESPVKAITAIVTAQTQRAPATAPQTPAQTETPEISPARAAARKELGQLLVPYSAESFVKQAEEGDSIAVKLFLAAGMNPNVIAKYKVGDNNVEATALNRAAQAGQTETVKVLIAGHADVNLNAGGWTPVTATATGGTAEIAKALLAAGAKVDSKRFDQTALMVAADYGQVEVLKVLLENGADTRGKADGTLTKALLLAAPAGNVKVIQPLLDAGADINARSNDGATPLILASPGIRNTDAVKLLLDRGADVNAARNDGRTAMMSAGVENTSIIKLLLDKNANVNARNNRGESILLQVAGYSEYPNFVGPSRFTDVQKAETVTMLVSRGADVNLSDNEGRTPLMLAAQTGSIGAVRMLVEKGADVNAKSKSSYTALKAAGERTDIVQLLLNAGAK